MCSRICAWITFTRLSPPMIGPKQRQTFPPLVTLEGEWSSNRPQQSSTLWGNWRSSARKRCWRPVPSKSGGCFSHAVAAQSNLNLSPWVCWTRFYHGSRPRLVQLFNTDSHFVRFTLIREHLWYSEAAERPPLILRNALLGECRRSGWLSTLIGVMPRPLPYNSIPFKDGRRSSSCLTTPGLENQSPTAKIDGSISPVWSGGCIQCKFLLCADGVYHPLTIPVWHPFFLKPDGLLRKTCANVFDSQLRCAQGVMEQSHTGATSAKLLLSGAVLLQNPGTVLKPHTIPSNFKELSCPINPRS